MNKLLVFGRCNGTSFAFLKFQFLYVLGLLVSMENGLTEDSVQKITGKKLCDIVELK